MQIETTRENAPIRRHDATGRGNVSEWVSAPREGFTARMRARAAQMSRTPEGKMVGMGATVGWGPRIGSTR